MLGSATLPTIRSINSGSDWMQLTSAVTLHLTTGRELLKKIDYTSITRPHLMFNRLHIWTVEYNSRYWLQVMDSGPLIQMKMVVASKHLSWHLWIIIFDSHDYSNSTLCDQHYDYESFKL